MKSFSYKSLGSLSKKEIQLNFNEKIQNNITFKFPDNSIVPALAKNVLFSNRNVVIGNEKNSLCFVEHLLACLNLLRLTNLEIEVFGEEIPLEDGSAKTFYEILSPNSLESLLKFDLKESIFVKDEKEHVIFAYPNNEFKITYLFTNPVDQSKIWVNWQEKDDLKKLLFARTFAHISENRITGLESKVLSYDENGFDLPFRFENEPAYHKLLDLFGDLSLSGVNPLDIKAHFVSIGGSHSLNVKMAKILAENLLANS